MKKTSRAKGFSTIEGLLILVIVLIIGGVSYYVWHSTKNTNEVLNGAEKTSNTTVSKAQKASTTDTYAGWKIYSNEKYGFSYKYPSNWVVSDEIASDSSKSATKQEFSTGLKLSTDTKYNNTMIVEVLNEDLSSATGWYDNYYAQSSSNKVTKTTNTLKNKQSAQYSVSNSGVDSKLYLFVVGNKTYAFGSVNEELNTQTSPNYWSDFQKVIESLTLK